MKGQPFKFISFIRGRFTYFLIFCIKFISSSLFIYDFSIILISKQLFCGLGVLMIIFAGHININIILEIRLLPDGNKLLMCSFTISDDLQGQAACHKPWFYVVLTSDVSAKMKNKKKLFFL